MDNVHEEWRPVVWYEGIYEVSDHGRVRRIAPKRGATVGRIQVPRLRGRGQVKYHQNALYDMEGNRVDMSTHTIVATAFHGPKPEGHEVNHIDGDKLNNRASNLEWVTHRENVRHAWATELCRGGEDHPKARLTEQDVRDIRRLYTTMSQRAMAELYSVAGGVIQSILEGKTWKHVAGGPTHTPPERAWKARPITHKGVTLSITDWARRTGIQRLTIKRRLDTLGWSVQKALTTPPRPVRKR